MGRGSSGSNGLWKKGSLTLGKIDRTPFSNAGEGKWKLNIKGGGSATIADISKGKQKTYISKVYDSNKNLIDKIETYSLNDAKSSAKERLKGAFMVGRR